MDEKYKISIIVPVFNAENFLRRTLGSIVNQSIGIDNLEVIIINDSSTDKSKEIIEEYSNMYDNFYGYHLKKNTGSPSIPRNIGIKKASADYIMFLDQDDTYEETICEVLFNKITQTKANIVKCTRASCFDGRKEPDFYFNEDIEEVELTSQDEPIRFVSIWNGIHQKSFLIKNNIYFPDSLAMLST